MKAPIFTIRAAPGIILYLVILFSVGCSPLKKEFTNSKIVNDHFTGFALYDPGKNEFLFEYNSDKFFTPASNTKILTLYASLVSLGDSVPGLYYIENEDSIIFWGSGDPAFLNPDVYPSLNVYNFLRNTEKTLVFSDANYSDHPFGPGWAWDDYNSYYSVEKSPFPIYGNYLTVKKDLNKRSPVFEPGYFSNLWIPHDEDSLGSFITRDRHQNLIHYYGPGDAEFERIIPFKYERDLFLRLMADTLERQVDYEPIPFDTRASIIYSVPTDSLLAPMMVNSDNFIAEQLLIMSAGVRTDTLNSILAIKKMIDEDLKDLPDHPQWVDGSGLSRYNLTTPRSVVKLWEKVAGEIPLERLFNIVAVGGEKGTIRNLYAGEHPFVYGKTGSLMNNHCLSGFLKTDTGNILIFSYMNSNYMLPSADIKSEMDRILRIVKASY